MHRPLDTIYRDFLNALLCGDTETAARFVAPGFRASISSTLLELSFAEYVAELDRQRTAFPDLGENIALFESVAEDGALVVTYTMTVTFTGTLVSTDGARSIQPNGNVIAIPSQDRVEFTEGNLIRHVEIVTDMGHTLNQLV